MLYSTRLTIVALLCFGHIGLVSADDYSFNQDDPTTGSNIRRKLFFGSALPISKTYKELAESERAIFRGLYSNMPETDEPPYPRYGLIDIYKSFAAAQGKLFAAGKVEMYVTVDGGGKPRKVDIYQSPDPEVSRVFSTVLLLTEFKAAVCNGQPCTMDFPLVLTLRVTH